MPPIERTAPPALGALGLLALVTGTFLPWLRSGTHERNSYEAGGAVRRLFGTTGWFDHLLALWPLVAIACAGAVALYLFSLRTVAILLAVLAALAGGAAATAALATTGTSFAAVAIMGPVITLTGATLVALAALLAALAAAAVPRRAP